MKKNAMLKVAAVVLVAVLLTTCAISSTFAKYVTDNEKVEGQSARLAAWGVTVDTTKISNNLSGLFATAYGSTVDEKVDAADDTTVVAPGTYGFMELEAVAKGTPEVSGEITVTADLDLGDQWYYQNTDTVYCPLVFYVANEPYAIGTKGITDVAGLEREVEKAINIAGTKAFEANQDLEDFEISLKVEWEWLFENGDSEQAKAEFNAKDTYLTDELDPTVSLDITVGVAQTGAAAARPKA